MAAGALCALVATGISAPPDGGVVDVGNGSGPAGPLDAGPGPTSIENDCCTASLGPGCQDAAVLVCVCEGDSFCCSGAYDALCVNQALTRCGQACGLPPPQSDCCSPASGPGCVVPELAACVCSIDPFCCAFRFDENCVNLARAECAASCALEGTGP
jgi:hypothetical protein